MNALLLTLAGIGAVCVAFAVVFMCAICVSLAIHGNEADLGKFHDNYGHSRKN